MFGPDLIAFNIFPYHLSTNIDIPGNRNYRRSCNSHVDCMVTLAQMILRINETLNEAFKPV